MNYRATAMFIVLLGTGFANCNHPQLNSAGDPTSDSFQLLNLLRCAVQEPGSFCDLGLGPLSPVYPNHAAWNDYIKNDAGSILTASETTCTGAETARRACVHAGIMRRVSTTRNSCLGLTATDSLGALEWLCRLNDAGQAEFTATGFNPGKKLSDLLDADAAAWRFMSVTVGDGFARATTQAVQPWSNPVVVDNDGIGAGQSSSGTVYLVTSNPAALNILDQDKVAFVVMPGVVHTGTAAGSEVIVNINNANFIWIEGEIDLNGDTAAFQTSGNFIAARGIRIYNGTGPAFPLIGGGNMRFSDIHISNMSNAVLFNVSHVLMSEVYIHNCDTAFNLASPENVIINAVVTGSGGSPISYSGADNVLINAVVAGVATNGLSISGGSSDLVINVAALNAGSVSISQISTNNLGYLNIAAAHSQTNGYDLVGGSNNNVFSGFFITGNNGVSDCDITGGPANPGITGGCAPADNSDHLLQTGADLSASFVGKVLSDDTVNGSDNNGSGVASSITDWTRFENVFRGWSPTGGSIVDTALRAQCAATCNIWDWSLSASDEILRARLGAPQGDSTFTHTFAGGGTETFLRNATEIMDDGYGDDDGLCESNERCLYTPNIGAYQGHGDLNLFGAVTSGSVRDILLFKYANNGR